MRLLNYIIKSKNWAWNPEKLQLIKDYVWKCPINIHGIWQSKDGFVKIIDNEWNFNEGFIYNGCTWVPSGPPAPTPNLPVKSLTLNPVPLLWKATLVHDAGYNYILEEGFPFKRSHIDLFFYLEAKKVCFKNSYLYWLGVRVFGLFIYIGKCVKQFITNLFTYY